MSSEQATLVDFGLDLSQLTEAEHEAYVACRENGVGVREFARGPIGGRGRSGTYSLEPRTGSRRDRCEPTRREQRVRAL